MPAKRELTIRQIQYTLSLASERISALQIAPMLGVARRMIKDKLRHPRMT
jgi:hypothetical protein